MKTPAMYINDLKNKGLAKTDADVSRLLGVSRTAICYWQDGRSAPNAEQALRLAELLNIDSGEILAECEAARAKTPETRKAWERIAARMAGATMASLIAVSALPPDAHAFTQDLQQSQASNFQKLREWAILSLNCRGCIHTASLSRYCSTATAVCIAALGQTVFCPVRFLSLPGK